jgi:hypothetical protein
MGGHFEGEGMKQILSIYVKHGHRAPERHVRAGNRRHFPALRQIFFNPPPFP